MPHRGSDWASLAVIAAGSVALAWSYARVFSGEGGDYVGSRFWVGIPRATATALVPMQLLAAVGFLAFVPFATGIAGRAPRTGILSYAEGYASTALFAVFFAASIAWPYAARSYLDEKAVGAATAADLLGAVFPLVVAAVCALLFTAGAFEGDMHPVSVVGVLLFSTVVVLADGVGWNAKLILTHKSGGD